MAPCGRRERLANPHRRPACALIVGALVATASLAILAFAVFLHWVNGKREDGYFTTGTVRVVSANRALTSDLDAHRGLVSLIGRDGFSRVRLRVRTTRGVSAFVGVARSGDVDDYFSETAITRLTDFDVGPFRPHYTETVGDEPVDPPGQQSFWIAKSEGTGPVTLDWDVEPGSWTLVLMNADASGGVQAQVNAGAQIPLVGTLAWVVSAVGAGVLALGMGMILLGLRRRPRPSSPGGSAWGA